MKFMQWLIKTILAAALVSGVSVATTWAVVNAYVQQLLGQYGAAGVAKPVGFVTMLSSMGGGSGPEDEASAPASAELPTSPNEDGDEEMPSGTAPEEEYPVPDNALPVMGQATQSETSEDEELYLSMDDLNEKKDNISDEDRMAIFAMLVTKLPPEEVQSISALMEDGLTAEELEQSSQILQQYLTPEEFSELVEILQKY